jgi:hypothetical protein
LRAAEQLCFLWWLAMADPFAAVVVEGRYPHQGCKRTAIEPTEFGEPGNDGGDRHQAEAWHGVERAASAANGGCAAIAAAINRSSFLIAPAIGFKAFVTLGFSTPRRAAARNNGPPAGL